jgi:pilus assembly protein Flp/PilA
MEPRMRTMRMTVMKSVLQRFARNESGVTAVEYGLIALLIAVFIIGALTLVGTSLSTVFNNIAAAV